MILRLDAIGDYILFRNFIKILKESERFKGYKFTICGNILWRELAEKYDKEYIDEFIWVDKNRFRKSSEWLYSNFLMLKLHLKGFEALLQPNDMNSRISDYIIKRCGIDNVISATERILPALNRNGSAMNSINAPIDNENKSVFLFYRNKKFIEKITDNRAEIKKPFFEIKKNASAEEYFVIFPGAGNNWRKWSPENFAKLCIKIQEISNSKIYICGNESDKQIAKEIMKRADIKNIVDKTGQTSLSQLVELITDAKLVISNETCAVHIGAAVNTMTICISNGNHFGRFNPYPEEITPLVKTIYPEEIYSEMHDYAAMVSKYFISSEIDINNISVNRVFDIFKKLMEKEKLNKSELQNN
ncbi:MAG TPA: glycosyltransferase family 9 protein [Ignavibacteria bacterium]|nr:glycosyltransferase family 9 protein [Ignavibacteria bacterium]